ncbi:MAG TPA: FAD-binding protein [Candidatus Limnocylindria bacterium]
MTTVDTLRPADAETCARSLADASGARRTVRVRGSGTKDYLGGELAPTDIVLETTAMRGVVAHVPADLTVTVAAGTTLVELRQTLAAAGQVLALDPPHGDRATIGGVVAANSTGFLRARYGGVRDQLIGTTLALADGTVAHAGGRVVKNVAGYDLNKLFIGSLGTLGVIVECTLKVLPRPAASAGLRARFARAADAFRAADGVASTSARPASLVVDATGRGALELLVLAEGGAPAVRRTLEIAATSVRASGSASEPDDAIADALAPLRELPAASDGVVVRASLPPAAQPAFADTAMRLEGFARLVADAATGTVRVALRGDDDVLVLGADAIVAAARVCGGTAHAERRPDSLRRRIAAWGDGDMPGLFLMRRLKESFDPNGILEPARGPVR